MTTETQRVVCLSRELTGEAFDVVAAFIGDLTKDVADKTFVETDAPIKVRRERVAAARNPSIRPEMSNAVERARRFTDDIAAAGGWQGNWEMIITPTGSHRRRPDDPIKTLCRIELYMTHRRSGKKRFTGGIALEATKVDGSGDVPLETAGLGVSKERRFVADNVRDTASTLTGQACSPASGREDESRSGDVASPESVISSHV